jgi:acetyl/propionyl-CoA carboxylase alpha subunit
MQIEAAEGKPLGGFEAEPRGHAIEARLYAEDAANGFLPSTGKILAWRPPAGVRVESGIAVGSDIGIHYDPMLAKFIAHAPAREEAIRKLRHSLETTLIQGVITNREFLIAVLDHPDFRGGCVHTGFAIPFTPDRSGEPVARAALEAWLRARTVARRKILPTIPPGYRNNPFLAPPAGATILSCDGAHVRVEIDGAQHAFDISEDAGGYWIGNYVFPRVSRYPQSESAGAGESASSPMPGQVLRILVEPGEKVRAGDPLVILEAMKMEQTVSAHADGIVDQILVTPRQVVAPGETLVHIRAKETQS